VQRKQALDEEVGVFEPASSETLVAITTSSRRAKSLTEETLESLHDLVKAGKARYIGASSMHAWQLARALGIAKRHG
jgi:aryl-alcohol dehydrogenase-like predicted oxidoreductase